MLSLFLNACSTLVEKAGRVLDGSAFRETALETWTAERDGPFGQGLEIRRVIRKKDKKEFLLIRVRAFPTLVLRASPAPGPEAPPLGRERGRFTLESLDFLSPSREGWNEFSRELIGGGVFRSDGYSAFFTLYPGVETLDISAGGIKRGMARIYGDEALPLLRHRDERIAALTLWMADYLAARSPAGGDAERAAAGFDGSAAFAVYWRPVLVPALVPQRKRAASWTAAAGDDWQRGEDVAWNTGYTRALFPEPLWPVRDSGTLLRDWEEALEWVYYQFEWQYIIQSLTSEIPGAGGGFRLTKKQTVR
jgi:hypothetical protein